MVVSQGLSFADHIRIRVLGNSSTISSKFTSSTKKDLLGLYLSLKLMLPSSLMSHGCWQLTVLSEGLSSADHIRILLLGWSSTISSKFTPSTKEALLGLYLSLKLMLPSSLMSHGCWQLTVLSEGLSSADHIRILLLGWSSTISSKFTPSTKEALLGLYLSLKLMLPSSLMSHGCWQLTVFSEGLSSADHIRILLLGWSSTISSKFTPSTTEDLLGLYLSLKLMLPSSLMSHGCWQLTVLSEGLSSADHIRILLLGWSSTISSKFTPSTKEALLGLYLSLKLMLPSSLMSHGCWQLTVLSEGLSSADHIRILLLGWSSTISSKFTPSTKEALLGLYLSLKLMLPSSLMSHGCWQLTVLSEGLSSADHIRILLLGWSSTISSKFTPSTKEDLLGLYLSLKLMLPSSLMSHGCWQLTVLSEEVSSADHKRILVLGWSSTISTKFTSSTTEGLPRLCLSLKLMLPSSLMSHNCWQLADFSNH